MSALAFHLVGLQAALVEAARANRPLLGRMRAQPGRVARELEPGPSVPEAALYVSWAQNLKLVGKTAISAADVVGLCEALSLIRREDAMYLGALSHLAMQAASFASELLIEPRDVRRMFGVVHFVRAPEVKAMPGHAIFKKILHDAVLHRWGLLACWS